MLKQNIPGRYNHWDRDSDEEEGRTTHKEDVGAEDEEEEDEDAEEAPPADAVPEAMRYGEAPGA